ncbi:hypothetical protein [Sulfuriflexus mobilis]|uniref:hypothetical protein n=1 Tax=Sulfuriflexus mobilis TaxID=1811807 RepID=UPI000F820425|nr:hypothetical protein [Sulfuriflexus mobilis]
MGSTPSDVIRIVGWEELPASVREIPSTHNPMADGLLMKHQKEWIALCQEQDLTIAEKGRRTGITYASALDGSITAASQKNAGGDNIYYIGDTKEKGLEFIGYCAHMAKVMAMAMAEGWKGIEVFLFEDQQEDGSSRQITAYRIRWATGFEIVALSSNPANIRGLQGIVIIDEAAFHQNVQAVIDAALALIIWGGKIRIISTHNGASNPFNQLIKDSRLGENDFKVYNVFFDDAVANGLYERVCFMKGWEPTPEGKKAWYKKVRGAYGSNRTAMLQELDGIPSEGSGVAIPGILIENCMTEERPVLRLALDDEFAVKTEAYKRSWVEGWINDHLTPVLDTLNPDVSHVFGEDFARHGDFSIVAPMSTEQNLARRVPFLLEMKNTPTRQQEQILWHLIERLPRFTGGAMDATGNGATLAEYTADKFGRPLIQEIMLNDAWYKANMIKVQAAFEDQVLDLPKDADIKNDIRALQMIDGIIKLPKLRTQDTKNSEFKRHGDSAIAIALAYIASLMDVEEYSYHAIPNPRRQQNVDRLSRPVRITAGFGRRGGIM